MRHDAPQSSAPERIIVIHDRCTHACPVGAIRIAEDGWPRVDADACTHCGICLGICDAFSSTRRTLRTLVQHVQRIAVTGRRVIFTCKENVPSGFVPDDNVVVLPCISCIPPEMWTLFLAEGIRMSIYCDLSYCDDCTRAPRLGGMLFPRSVQIAQERTGGVIRAVDEISERPKPTSADDPLGRRQAFDNLVGNFSAIASGKRRLMNSTTLQDVYVKRQRKEAIAQLNLIQDDEVNKLMPHGTTHRVAFPKQKMLIETLMDNPDSAERTDIRLSTTHKGMCQRGNGCNGAYECVRICPTGARSIDTKTKDVDLSPLICIGCGACENVCPAQAVAVETTTAKALLPYLSSSEPDE